jgi:anti-sigma B factor antagonist
MHEFRLDIVGPNGDCAVLQVSGEVDAYTAPMLREQIRELTAKGVVHLIADLSQVDFLDSTGLGALVGGLKRLREAGGSLTLVIVAPRILRLFQITGLTKVLAIHPSVADAITADPRWQHTAENEAGSVHLWCQQHALS